MRVFFRCGSILWADHICSPLLVPDFFVRVSAAAKPIIFLHPIFFVAGQVICSLFREPVFDLRAYTVPGSWSVGLGSNFVLAV
jgi:hypothetical protein